MTIQIIGKLTAKRAIKAVCGKKRSASSKLRDMLDLCCKMSPVLALLVLALKLTIEPPQPQVVILDAEQFQFGIKSEKASEAPNAFAGKTDSEILFTSNLVKGKASCDLVGEYSDVEALKQILEDTGLQFERVEEKVFLAVILLQQIKVNRIILF